MKGYEVNPAKKRGHASGGNSVFRVCGRLGPECDMEEECKYEDAGAETNRAGREEDREHADCPSIDKEIKVLGMPNVLTIAAYWYQDGGGGSGKSLRVGKRELSIVRIGLKIPGSWNGIFVIQTINYASAFNRQRYIEAWLRDINVGVKLGDVLYESNV